ncbi:ABC-2 type transporter [Caldicellulosiruptor obsidiansis OB47]|uniref:ABC-2 type transporter n=1 Tax=Caldicellulosiruptor obsidiansis (strain ATCC BAA-2073 / JCM 16842 / OB47) TaxID=608506 RepID=D9TH76_CALOO|nr:ABC transporter permease [Caldicellulosiruptor obsidiansis]ADL43473.1 ABC-2 type transporter [Caldicellulosiruptor obsidiansis OB47]
MKSAVKAFFFTLKENIMSIPLLSIMLIFPIIIIFILGNALSGYFKQTDIPKTNIILVFEDNLKPYIYDILLKNDKTFSKLFYAEVVSSKSDAIKRFSNSNKYAAVVLFKECQENNPKSYSPFGFDIQITAKEGFPEAGFVKVYFSIFSNYYKFAKSIYTPQDIPENVEFESAFSGRFPRAIDYYAVTMVVMMALYGAFAGVAVIEEERRQNTLIRLFASPERPQIIFVSKALAQTVFLYAQLCIIIIFSKLVYHANWGKNLSFVFLLILIYSVFCILLGILIALVARSYVVSNVLISSFSVIATFLVGGYTRVDITNRFLVFIRDILPNNVVQSTLFSIIYNSSEITVLKNAFVYFGVLCAAAAIICIFLMRMVKPWQFSK